MTEERKKLISRKELCQVTGVSYNELVQQFRNELTNTPVCVQREGHEWLYERDAAIEWVHYWRSGAHKKRLQEQHPKLMHLAVKWGKPREIVQKLDKLEKEFYSQHINE
jgi:AraC-like DNA-binding protein